MIKLLDVIVDRHLNWKDHISNITQTSRMRNTFDIKSKKIICDSLIDTDTQ